MAALSALLPREAALPSTCHKDVRLQGKAHDDAHIAQPSLPLRETERILLRSSSGRAALRSWSRIQVIYGHHEDWVNATLTRPLAQGSRLPKRCGYGSTGQQLQAKPPGAAWMLAQAQKNKVPAWREKKKPEKRGAEVFFSTRKGELMPWPKELNPQRRHPCCLNPNPTVLRLLPNRRTLAPATRFSVSRRCHFDKPRSLQPWSCKKD